MFEINHQGTRVGVDTLFPIGQPNPCGFAVHCTMYAAGCDAPGYKHETCSEWCAFEERAESFGLYSGQCVRCGKVSVRGNGKWVVIPKTEDVRNKFGATPGGVFCPDCRQEPNAQAAERKAAKALKRAPRVYVIPIPTVPPYIAQPFFMGLRWSRWLRKSRRRLARARAMPKGRGKP